MTPRFLFLSIVLWTVSGFGAEILRFEPSVDTVYCGGGCTPPEFIINIHNAAPYTYVNIAPGWNTQLWYFNSTGAQIFCQLARFVIRDDNSSIGSIWLKFRPLTPPGPPQILPLDSAISFESQEFTITCYISQISGIDSLSQNFSTQVGLPVLQTENTHISEIQLTIYPNPFNSDSRIQYVSPSAGTVGIDLYNILGQKLQTIYHGKIEPGVFEIPWSPLQLPAGVYFIAATQGNHIRITKTLLIK